MELHIAEVAAVIGRYLASIQFAGYLDIAIMAFVLYRVLLWVRSTRATSLLKGLLIFLAALLFSTLFNCTALTTFSVVWWTGACCP